MNNTKYDVSTNSCRKDTVSHAHVFTLCNQALSRTPKTNLSKIWKRFRVKQKENLADNAKWIWKQKN